MSVVQSLASLAGNIQQVPDGKTVVLGQHPRDTFPLYVLRGGTEFPVNFARPVQYGKVVAAQNLGGFRFRQNGLHQRGHFLGRQVRLQHFQCNGLAGLRVGGLINARGIAVRDFAQNLKSADIFRHLLRLTSIDVHRTRFHVIFHCHLPNEPRGE